MSQPTEIDALCQTLTADLPSLDAAARAAAWDTVRTSFATSPPRLRRRRRRVRASWRSWRSSPVAIRIALPAVGIACALTIAIALGGRNGAAPVPAPLDVPTARAAAILRQAARHLAHGTLLSGSQARVIREDYLQLVVAVDRHGDAYRYVLPRTTESGYDALGNSFYEELPDGAPRFANAAAHAAYVRRFGRYVPIAPKPRIESHYGADTPDPNFLNLSAHDVLTLPTDPTALLARLRGQRRGLAEQSEPHDLVSLAARLLTFGPTPPAVRAGLARVLATLPGVRRVGTARIGGHLADILAFPPVPGVGVAQRLAFDRRTGELLEEIDVCVRRGRALPGVAPGTVINAIAYSTAVAPSLDTSVQPPAIMPADGPRP